jgi:hypothetical protein
MFTLNVLPMAMKILPVTRSSCLLNLLPTISCFLIFDTTILPVSDGFVNLPQDKPGGFSPFETAPQPESYYL